MAKRSEKRNYLVLIGVAVLLIGILGLFVLNADTLYVSGKAVTSSTKSVIEKSPQKNVQCSISKNIPVGETITGNNKFDNIIGPDLLSYLNRFTINFGSKTIKARELIVSGQAINDFNDPNFVTVADSISSHDKNYENDVFLESTKDSLKYYYAFDTPILVSSATPENPLIIKFLGKFLKITGTSADGTAISAEYGNDRQMKVGETFSGIKLENVGNTGSIAVNVNGVSGTIAEGKTKLVGGINIFNWESFFHKNINNRKATLVIDAGEAKEFRDGDVYIGENENSPHWTWNIGGLQENTLTIPSAKSEFLGPYIGIENDIVYDDASDYPPTVGECLKFPRLYLKVCLDNVQKNAAKVTIKGKC
ncbi:hypothetical protein J4231_02950 [Candidatus Woesearchaeota archaeon]|nr:hypothetical protein [Candidatus Woesearchaeota archaeon]